MSMEEFLRSLDFASVVTLRFLENTRAAASLADLYFHFIIIEV